MYGRQSSRAIEPRALQMRFHAQTAGSTLTAQQPENNIVRTALQALAAVPASLGQSSRLLKKRQADLVIGVGGYTSPTVLLAAFLRRIPSVILEPNAYPGLANRVVAPLARRIFLAFESGKQFFRQKTVRVVGMPVDDPPEVHRG